MADDSARPDLRRAYREAWDTRKATGDTSDAVLLRRLHLHGLFLDPESSGALDVVLAADDVFAEGTLDAHESGGLLVVEGLSYGGVPDDEDDEDD